MKKSLIYTKTGDRGTTALVGGRRISKSDIRLEAYGETDELNAFIGLLLGEKLDETDIAFLLFLQNSLFNLGAYLATDPDNPHPATSTISATALERIEREIDRIDSSLPPIRSFLLPGGNRISALAHVCRTVCRRAERAMYRLHEESPVEANALAFINRMSDYFFVLSRQECLRGGGQEIKWNNACE
jgi:cob(I)alamin adenosyltransferase